MSTLREAAFFALTGESFIEESLFQWQQKVKPTQRDFNLAFEIANGTMRQKGVLEKIAKQHVQALPRKKKEKMLLYMMLYQLYFLERIPLYAVVQEGVEIAKKEISLPFSKFLNATFRNFEKKEMKISDAESYPDYFVKRLRAEYGNKADAVFQCMNQVYPLQARDRKTHQMIEVTDLQSAIQDTSIYIQNGSFVKLILELKKHLKKVPETILDLASSPGGKLILVHDLFPNAELFANDIDVRKLEENLKKYKVKATVTEGRAENYPSFLKYDLIICDLPCSNSGVFGKRPEARWRLNEKSVEELESLQIMILKHAKTHLKPDGQIWYMTCSILKEENEEVVKKSGLKPLFQTTHLPDENGFDGGFGAVLV